MTVYDLQEATGRLAFRCPPLSDLAFHESGRLGTLTTETGGAGLSSQDMRKGSAMDHDTKAGGGLIFAVNRVIGA